MTLTPNTFIKIWVVAVTLALIWRLFTVVLRVEYAEHVLARTPGQRERLLQSYRKIILQFKVLLLLYPMIVVSFIAIYWAFPALDGLMLLIALVELGLLLATEYLYETWLVRYITEHEEPPSVSTA